MLSFDVPSSMWSDLTGPGVFLWNLFGDVKRQKSRLFYNLQDLQDLSTNLTLIFVLRNHLCGGEIPFTSKLLAQGFIICVTHL